MTREMILALTLGYLFGSIPFGLILARLGGKGDIRKIGSGNIGATNVLRSGSKGLAALTLGYLFGSIPFGLILARLGGKGDIRKIGSGNIGATNVLRSGSKGLAALTLVLDCLKATAAILIAGRLFGEEAMPFAATGALLGHLYPVWLKFRGGKGVATYLGILIPLLPTAAIVYAVIWLGLLLTIRISSVAGIAAAASVPITAAIVQSSLFLMLLGFTLLVLWKHRENIVRLTKGTEPRIGTKTSPTG